MPLAISIRLRCSSQHLIHPNPFPRTVDTCMDHSRSLHPNQYWPVVFGFLKPVLKRPELRLFALRCGSGSLDRLLCRMVSELYCSLRRMHSLLIIGERNAEDVQVDI